MFNKFMPGDHEEDPIFHPKDPSSAGPTNLADLILEKIAEHEARQAGEPGAPKIQGGGLAEDAVQIPAKAVEVYEKYVMKCDVICSRLMLINSTHQGRHDSLSVQVRTPPEAFQDSPICAKLANSPRHHPPRELDW